MAAPQLAAPQPVGDLLLNIAAFRRNLRQENAAPNTVLAYIGALEQLPAYLASQGMPTDVAKVRREHVESFIADLQERWKPATANTRFRGCRRFFNRMVEEGELKQSPMARMRPPRAPDRGGSRLAR